MPHNETNACLERAERLMKCEDAISFRYASLELRMGIEYLFYELIPIYQKQLPDDIRSNKWQPSAILNAILECDPDADLDARHAFGPSQKEGEPSTPTLVLESKAPTKGLLDRHYHRLGRYLHAPVSMVDPSIDKWKNDLVEAAKSLRGFQTSQVLSSVGLNIHVECVCKRMIVRNKRGVQATGTIQCPDPNCDSSGLSDSGGDQIMIPVGGPKDERISAGSGSA